MSAFESAKACAVVVDEGVSSTSSSPLTKDDTSNSRLNILPEPPALSGKLQIVLIKRCTLVYCEISMHYANATILMFE